MKRSLACKPPPATEPPWHRQCLAWAAAPTAPTSSSRASYAACLVAIRSATDSQSNNRACPNFLKPVGPRRNGRTCLRVEALPVEMDGLTVGWAWWDDDDMAADCEYVPFDMSEEKSFGGAMVRSH